MGTGHTAPVMMTLYSECRSTVVSSTVPLVNSPDGGQSKAVCALPCWAGFQNRMFLSPSSLLQVVAAAKVCEIAHESPSVKSLRLLVADKDFSFKAGQW